MLRSAGAQFAQLLERAEVHDAALRLVVSCAAVSEAMALPRRSGGAATFVQTCPVRLTRTGRAIRLVHSDGALAARGDGADPAMLRLISKARAWWQELSAGHLDPTALAEREGVTLSWVIRVVRLTFLSPRVIEGILAGRLRASVDASELLKAGTISLDWEQQEKQLLAG
jgi:hypothetical protein